MSGPWALVAGGSGGIGRAIGRRLAADGWNVALTYRSRPEAAEAAARDVTDAGGRAVTVALDLEDAAATAEVVRTATPEPPSAVVYAAGPHIPMRYRPMPACTMTTLF